MNALGWNQRFERSGRMMLLIAISMLACCQSSNNQVDVTSRNVNDQLAVLMDSLWDFRDAPGSEMRFRGAATEAENESLRLGLLTQVARAQGLQRRFTEAHATLDIVAQEIGQDQKDKTEDPLLPLYAIERGRVFNSSGNQDRAHPYFLQAWDAAVASGDDALAVDAGHMLAIVATGSDAVEWNERALSRAESSSDERARRWRASLHNNLGWAYHEDRQYERALNHFERALAAREQRGQMREVLIARWAVARCLRSLERAEEALAMQKQLRVEWENLGEQDGYVFEEIGECLLVLGRTEEARPHFAKSHDLLRQDTWLSTNEPSRLKRLARLGGVEAD